MGLHSREREKLVQVENLGPQQGKQGGQCARAVSSGGGQWEAAEAMQAGLPMAQI